MKHVETVPKVLQNAPSVKFLINVNFEFLSQVFLPSALHYWKEKFKGFQTSYNW